MKPPVLSDRNLKHLAKVKSTSMQHMGCFATVNRLAVELLKLRAALKGRTNHLSAKELEKIYK